MVYNKSSDAFSGENLVGKICKRKYEEHLKICSGKLFFKRKKSEKLTCLGVNYLEKKMIFSHFIT